jgi:hypothetical protein
VNYEQVCTRCLYSKQFHLRSRTAHDRLGSAYVSTVFANVFHQSSGNTSPRVTPPRRARPDAYNQQWTQHHAANHLSEVVEVSLQFSHFKIIRLLANVELRACLMYLLPLSNAASKTSQLSLNLTHRSVSSLFLRRSHLFNRSWTLIDEAFHLISLTYDEWQTFCSPPAAKIHHLRLLERTG